MLKILKSFIVILITSLFSNLNAQQLHSIDRAPFAPLNNFKQKELEIISMDNISSIISYAAYLNIQTSESKFASIPLPSGQPITDIGQGFGITTTQTSDFGPEGILYAVSSPNLLVRINLITGARSTVANITGTSGTITSMAYNEFTSTMYLGTTNIEVSRLYTLNLSTGVTSLVGIISNCPGLIALAINCEGNAYAFDIVGDNLLSVNLATAAGNIIGSLGFNANFLQDADFDPDNGILYLAAYNAGTNPGTGQLRIADLNTGATTLLTNWGQGIEVTGYAIPGACFFENDVSSGPFKPFPDEFVINNTYNIKAVIKNPGFANQSNFPVKFFVNGIEQNFVNLSLNSGAEDSVSYSWTPSATGTHQLRIVTALHNDEKRSNDTVTASVQVYGSETMTIFCDDFSNGSGNWTITNDGGTCMWQVYTPPYPNDYTLPPGSSGGVLSADSDECGQTTTLISTATITNILDCSGKENITLSWDNDWRYLPSCIAKVEVSYNGGSSWSTVVEWEGVPRRNSHEVYSLPGASNNPDVKIRFISIQPEWAWWWAIDNVCITGNIILGLNQTAAEIPGTFKLFQNYPNPFNPSTKIRFDLSGAGSVKLSVLDITGKTVAVLVDQELQAGSYNYTFNAANLSSGIYFYRLETGSFTGTKKMIVIK